MNVYNKKKTDKTKYWEGLGAPGILMDCVEVYTVAVIFLKTVQQNLLHLNIFMPYVSAILTKIAYIYLLKYIY